MRWRPQYSIRSLLMLTAVAAAVFAWWRWYESNRPGRELKAAIRITVKDDRTRNLFCALVWQPQARPLLEKMNAFQQLGTGHFVLPIFHSVEWDGVIATNDGIPRRVFLITCPVISTGYVVVTDSELNLIAWAEGPGTFESAQLKEVNSQNQLILEGRLYGMQSLNSARNWWMWRYDLTDAGIEKVPIEFVAKPKSKVQEQLQPVSQSTFPLP